LTREINTASGKQIRMPVVNAERLRRR